MVYKKFNGKKKLKHLQKNIKKYNKKLWKIEGNVRYKQTNSWFHYGVIKNNSEKININFKKPITTKYQIKAEYITLKPTEFQKKRLLSWFEGHRLMYNYTLKYIKSLEFKNNLNKEIIIDRKWTSLKKILKDQKLYIRKTYKTPIKVLDQAIKEVCSNYKSAFANLKQSNINHFCIKYIGKNKKTYIAKIEAGLLTFNEKNKTETISPTILGKHLESVGKYSIKQISKMRKPGSEEAKQGGPICTLHYNIETKEIRLYIPIYVETEVFTKNKYVSIDPGIRTFLTCYGKDEAFKIGSNYKRRVNKFITKYNKAEKSELKKTKLKKLEKKMNKKILNSVIDLHWKSIKILTKNYDTIIIGKWSTKDIICKKRSKLAKKTKVLAQRTNFFKFLSRLEYKCKLKNINFVATEESYTSRVCSSCGLEKKNLGGNKYLNCNGCHIRIDRDYNGAKNILLKVLKKHNFETGVSLAAH